MPSDAVKLLHHQTIRKRSPVKWAVGERETLIAQALADGKVKQVKRGASGFENSAAPQFSSWIKSS